MQNLISACKLGRSVKKATQRDQGDLHKVKHKFIQHQNQNSGGLASLAELSSFQVLTEHQPGRSQIAQEHHKGQQKGQRVTDQETINHVKL